MQILLATFQLCLDESSNYPTLRGNSSNDNQWSAIISSEFSCWMMYFIDSRAFFIVDVVWTKSEKTTTNRFRL